MPPEDSLDRLERITEMLSRLYAQLETLRVLLAAQCESSRDHEDRLRLLERWQHSLTPVLAAGTFLLGLACSLWIEKLL